VVIDETPLFSLARQPCKMQEPGADCRSLQAFCVVIGHAIFRK
jgi:hypothetical protein